MEDDDVILDRFLAPEAAFRRVVQKQNSPLLRNDNALTCFNATRQEDFLEAISFSRSAAQGGKPVPSMTSYQQRRIRQSEAPMNYTMSRPLAKLVSALVTPLAISAGLLLLHSSARATEVTPSDQIAGTLRVAQSATSAEVFIVADTLSSIRPITQEQIPSYGCRYQVAESGMRDLLAIINQADLKHAAAHFMPP